MLYEAKTPAEYLTQLEDDWRKEKLSEIRELILSADKSIVEGINYKMLSYGDDKGIMFHLNAQKNYVSFYTGDASKVDPDGSLLNGIDVGKGCLRFKKSINVSDTQLADFIDKAISIWKQGGDIDC